MNFNKFLFMMTMTWGMTLAMSSNTWLMIWIGMELMLMSFLPMMSNKTMLSSESSMKYFIVQSISSSLMMWGMLLMLVNSNLNYEVILISSIMLKIGAAPFHNWVLELIEGLDLWVVTILLTVMKMAPLNLMSYLSLKSNLFAMISLAVGSVMGLNQTSIRKIMGYSSIYNLSFVILTISINSVWLLFMLLYTIMLSMTMIMVSKIKASYINQMMINEMSMMSKLNMWMLMLSMGGMPPMLGFMAKLIVIQVLLENNELMLSAMMIIASMLVMFFYIRMSYMSIMFSSLMMKWKIYKTSKLSNTLITLNIMIMPLLMTMKCYT